MPHNIFKKTRPEYDPDKIQKKIDLIEKGLPIDIEETELKTLEDTFRGAHDFYVDILDILSKQQKTPEIEANFTEESKNLAGVTLALRKIDDFRRNHRTSIK